MSAEYVIRDAPREVLAGGRVKGGMMAAHVGWATGGRAPRDVAAFWSALPFALQRSLGGKVDVDEWYEFADLIAVDRAIVNTYGGGGIGILRDIGAYSARLNLAGMCKSFGRDAIHQFLENGARLHRQFQDFGEVACLALGAESRQMVHGGYCSYSPMYCESALGYYRESLALHGARNISVEETICQCRGGESCTFALRWR